VAVQEGPDTAPPFGLQETIAVTRWG